MSLLQHGTVSEMVSIRKATESDAGVIAHVHVQSWLTTYTGIVPGHYLQSLNEAERVPLWLDWLTRDILVYVAELDGQVVGFISGGPLRHPIGEYDGELFALYLLQRAQRRGIGTALLQQLAESLQRQGFKSLAVWVLASNPSLPFYEKRGAVPLTQKEIEIGGAQLQEVALGWPDLQSLSASE